MVKEIAETMNVFSEITFMDDNSSEAIGRIDKIECFTKKYRNAVVAIGNAETRMKFITILLNLGIKVPVLVSPKAYVSGSCHLGDGTIVEPLVVINTDTVIGKGCIISAGAVVNHNCIIDDGCHINCNATIEARVHLTKNIKIECGEVIKNDV